MATNPYKSFIPFTATLPDKLPAIDLLNYSPVDPSAGAWSTAHLWPLLPGEPIFLSTGNTVFTSIRFNERILPGKVRDEQLGKEVAKLEQLQGHKISKKEYAQLRDQVEFDLLPRAFIRRTVVPVIFTMGYMLVCTSSVKRCDDVVALLQSVLGSTFKPWKIETVLPVSEVLTTLAREDRIVDADGDDTPFNSADSAVVKGDGKRAIRIQDIDVQAADMQALLQQEDYRVTELGVVYNVSVDSDDTLAFAVTEKMVFKRLAMPDVAVTPYKEDALGFVQLCASTYASMLYEWVLACAGLDGQPVTPGADDEDEL